MSFTWNGKSSASFGIEVTRLPSQTRANRRGKTMTVTGRDGVLFIDDESMDEIALMVEGYLPYEQGGVVSSMDDVRKWLTGEGWFTQSDIPGRKFKGRITDGIDFNPLVDGFRDKIFGVTIYAEPYQYKDPEPAEQVVAESGATVTNNGTAAARPIITVTGSGDITLNVSANVISFDGIEDGVIVDSELMECLALNRAELLNSKASMDEFPVLNPGANVITWTGAVDSVRIKFKERYI